MAITLEETRRIAALARLELPEEELVRLAGDLSRILDFAAELGTLDTSDVPPTAHVQDLVNVWRDDEPKPGVDRETALAEAPEARDGCFLAPKIV